MANQLELKRQQYIQACVVKAQIEAEMQWGQIFATQSAAVATEETVDREQAAKLLKRSRSFVRDKEESGQLPRVQGLGPKTVRYLKSDVMRLAKLLEREHG